MESIREILKSIGVFQYGIVKTEDIQFAQDVRNMCAANVCRQYGKTWACPPAVGTVEECRQRVLQYENMLVFSGKYKLEDSFDFEGMKAGMKDFKEMSRRLNAAVKPLLSRYLILSNEGCDLCASCTYPDAPCRFPDQSHGALEGYGIFVNQLANQAGINYINGANTVTYFGGLLFNGDIL